MNGAPLQGWAQIALGAIAAVVLAVVVIVAVSRRRDPRWLGVHRGPVAGDFHEATFGDGIPIVRIHIGARALLPITPEPYELGAGLDIDAGSARLDLLEAELERIEWDGLVHDHDLDEFFARVAEVEAGERAYRDALLDHLIGAQL